MKILHYLLGASILISGIDLIFTTSKNLYACPRCRRALPKGPRKRPHPGFPKKDTVKNFSQKSMSENVPQKITMEKLNE
jgi:hypothetical protein